MPHRAALSLLVAVLALPSASAVGQEPQPSFEDLERKFQSGDAEGRAQIAEQWGKRREAKAVGVLARALASDSAAIVRTKAAWALGAMSAPEGVSALTRALATDAEGKVRYWAAWALGRLGRADGVSALERALDDRDASVRAQAAAALGSIGERSATQALGRALKDPVKQVRTAAVVSLQRLGVGDAFIRNNLPSEDRDSELTAERKSHGVGFALGLVGGGLIYAEKKVAGWTSLGLVVLGAGAMAATASGAFATRTICQDGTALTPDRTTPCGFSTQEDRDPGKKFGFIAGAVVAGGAWIVNLVWSQVAITRFNQRVDEAKRTAWTLEPYINLTADAKIVGATIRF